MNKKTQKLELATLAGGCFWCTEAVFQRLKGVEGVVSGYSGGEVEDPSYREISRGGTGYAEAVQIRYDPDVISYQKLLGVFFLTHDPTTMNRQGPDVGSQYRSMIFYHDEKQKELAEKMKNKLEEKRIYPEKIITEIVPFEAFYEASEEHQDFYRKNKGSGYCRVVIDPKLAKLRKIFKEITKD